MQTYPATTEEPGTVPSPLARLAAVFEPAGYEYRPSYFGSRLHAEQWRNEAGTVISVQSWDGYGAHFVLGIDNQRHNLDGSTYANDADPGEFEDGARRALAIARRFTTLATGRATR